MSAPRTPEQKGKRLVIEAIGQLPLDPEVSAAIGEIVADALNAEGYSGFVELIEEDMEAGARP